MFTSEPSLAQRIERMIGDTPIVDSHARIRPSQPNAPDLAALIMGGPQVQAGLIASGMPPADLDPGLPPDERVRRSIPYLERMRNTAVSWCLHRIFRDLYDFDEPNLTVGNYRDLFDKVARTGPDPDWARAVLRDRSNIRAVVTELGYRSADESNDLDFFYRFDVQALFCPGVATDLGPPFEGRTERGSYLEALESLLGDRPSTADRLERLIFDRLDRTIKGRVRFAGTFLSVEHRFHPPETSAVRAILGRTGAGREMTDDEVGLVAGFASWSVLKWHHEHKKAFQVALGGENLLGGGNGVPRSPEPWASAMARTFRHFEGARFDLLISSKGLGHDVAMLAGQLPNVYASGDRGPDFSPTTIGQNVALRIQMAPMTKVGGFVSDAPYAEWSYGKLQVVRKAMAAGLAGLVDSRFFEEDEIPPLLRQILHDTPRDLHALATR